MTVYARSDMASVSISPAHGGCGSTHIRPAPGGKSDALWALECPACEDFLRSDPLWSPNPVEVPETPDEVKIREDREKRGEHDRLAAIGGYLAADQEFKQMFLQLMGGMAPRNAVAGAVECPDGHANAAGARFCAECGTAMGGREAKAELPPVPEPRPEPAVPEVKTGPVCEGCGKPVERKPGARGPVPRRCPDCKKKK